LGAIFFPLIKHIVFSIEGKGYDNKNGTVGEGRDLTPIVTMNRRVGLPLLKGEGIMLISFLCDGVVEFPNVCLVLEGL